jgi:hypothetical protein
MTSFQPPGVRSQGVVWRHLRDDHKLGLDKFEAGLLGRLVRRVSSRTTLSFILPLTVSCMISSKQGGTLVMAECPVACSARQYGLIVYNSYP